MLRPPQQQNQETMQHDNDNTQNDNPYVSWWKNLEGTQNVALVVLVDDNARNDCVYGSTSLNNKASTTSCISKVGSSRSKSTWNPSKDSVVGFATNKNRWGGSPEGEKEWFRLQQKHRREQQQQEQEQQQQQQQQQESTGGPLSRSVSTPDMLLHMEQIIDAPSSPFEYPSKPVRRQTLLINENWETNQEGSPTMLPLPSSYESSSSSSLQLPSKPSRRKSSPSMISPVVEEVDNDPPKQPIRRSNSLDISDRSMTAVLFESMIKTRKQQQQKQQQKQQQQQDSSNISFGELGLSDNSSMSYGFFDIPFHQQDEDLMIPLADIIDPPTTNKNTANQLLVPKQQPSSLRRQFLKRDDSTGSFCRVAMTLGISKGRNKEKDQGLKIPGRRLSMSLRSNSEEVGVVVVGCEETSTSDSNNPKEGGGEGIVTSTTYSASSGSLGTSLSTFSSSGELQNLSTSDLSISSLQQQQHQQQQCGCGNNESGVGEITTTGKIDDFDLSLRSCGSINGGGAAAIAGGASTTTTTTTPATTRNTALRVLCLSPKFDAVGPRLTSSLFSMDREKSPHG